MQYKPEAECQDCQHFAAFLSWTQYQYTFLPAKMNSENHIILFAEMKEIMINSSEVKHVFTYLMENIALRDHNSPLTHLFNQLFSDLETDTK